MNEQKYTSLELSKKLRKGICPKCGKDLDYNEDYGYAYCECGYKIGARELKRIQNL